MEGLRKRVAELESGDRQTLEARENARRLATALDREREERRRQQQREVDDAHWRQASREEVTAVRAANAALKARLAKNTARAPRRDPIAEIAVTAIVVVGGAIAALIEAVVK